MTPPSSRQRTPLALETDTPAIRLLSLLEVISLKDQFLSLHELVEETSWPKQTVHRMLQQLETAGMLQRDGDGRQYSTGARLRQLAENLLLNNTTQGARRAVLQQLSEEVGENCNLTAISGNEVLYLDRVETTASLRFYLHPGSRVPVHCSASGKLFLTQMTRAQRHRLLGHTPLARHTEHTLTDLEQLEASLVQIKNDSYALDIEEFLPGLLCIAVPVPMPSGPTNMVLAIQGPIVRLTAAKAVQFLPRLRHAAQALAAIAADQSGASPS